MTHIADFPNITANEHAQSHALKAVIKECITDKGGILSFADFMQLALYHPEFGYYHTLAFHPHKGDFITAPEISPLFAECFARQCLPILEQLQTQDILEIGAGSGRFARDLLLAFEKAGLSSVQYIIYEPSLYLRKQQQIYIKKTSPQFFSRIQWVETLPSNFIGIIIANEVLDALPVHRFRIDKNILEKGVIWKNDHFAWQTSLPFSAGLQEKVQFLQSHYELMNGYESEINLQLSDFIQSLSRSLSKGMILLADYGYGQREYYHPERMNGTLTCFYRHHYHREPLVWPGVQDITSHVDFTQTAEYAVEYDLHLAGYTTQSNFLLALGIIQLAEEKEKILSENERIQLHQAIKQLLLPSEMGECIKMMALDKNMDNIFTRQLQGFSTSDRRRDL